MGYCCDRPEHVILVRTVLKFELQIGKLVECSEYYRLFVVRLENIEY